MAIRPHWAWFEAATVAELPAPEWPDTEPSERAAVLSIEPLLDELAKRRWEKWAFGDARNPVGLAYVLRWPEHADVVVLHGPTFAVTYRAYRSTEDHAFTPDAVAWLWAGEPAHAIRNLLTLPPPGVLTAPCRVLRHTVTARVPKTWLTTRPQLMHPSQ